MDQNQNPQNEETPKHPGGRPLKFKTVKELEEKIDAYFKSCWEQKIDMWGNPVFVKDKDGKKTDEKVMVQSRPYTITGLAVALGTSRQTLLEYQGEVDGRGENLDPEFADAIKRAKEMCHEFAESALFKGNAAGPIFNLKNNYGWKEKTEVDLTSKGEKLSNAESEESLNKIADEVAKKLKEQKTS